MVTLDDLDALVQAAGFGTPEARTLRRAYEEIVAGRDDAEELLLLRSRVETLTARLSKMFDENERLRAEAQTHHRMVERFERLRTRMLALIENP